VKRVAILLVSLAAIGLIVWLCFFPPAKMPDYVIGDEKCDICGQPAVYSLRIEQRYLVGEYCRTHRWFGIVHGAPWNTVTKILLGAAVFGVIYAVTSTRSRSKEHTQEDDDDHEADSDAQWRPRER
jgi:hypothetical protein